MATSVRLYPRKPGSTNLTTSPLPQLLHTPSGLALLELQGIINFPQTDAESSEGSSPETPIGRIIFPDFDPNALGHSTSTSWMKEVHLYVGQHQRLTGEVKKLPKAIAVIRKRQGGGDDSTMAGGDVEGTTEDLEIVEIVKYKLIFSQRPEPVGTS